MADAKYLFIVSMDVAADKEDLFNEVYDTEHVPYISTVPGVLKVRRAKQVPLKVNIGGEVKDIVIEGEPAYTAIYELESPDVLLSAAWTAAVEKGRWASEVRAHTTNRRHVLCEVMG